MWRLRSVTSFRVICSFRRGDEIREGAQRGQPGVPGHPEPRRVPGEGLRRGRGVRAQGAPVPAPLQVRAVRPVRVPRAGRAVRRRGGLRGQEVRRHGLEAAVRELLSRDIAVITSNPC